MGGRYKMMWCPRKGTTLIIALVFFFISSVFISYAHEDYIIDFDGIIDQRYEFGELALCNATNWQYSTLIGDYSYDRGYKLYICKGDTTLSYSIVGNYLDGQAWDTCPISVCGDTELTFFQNGQAQGGRLIILFPDGFYFTNNTNIEYYVSTNAAAGRFKQIGLYDIDMRSLAGFGGTFENGTVFFPDNAFVNTTTGWNLTPFYNPNYQVLLGSYLGSGYNTLVHYIVFETEQTVSGGGAYLNFSIAKIVINDTTVAETDIDNHLPECEMIYNNTNLCYRTETGEALFTFNLNCTDNESDTIYYSYNNEIDELGRYTWYKQGFDSFEYCEDDELVSNYSFSCSYEDSESYIAGWDTAAQMVIGDLMGNNIMLVDNGVSQWSVVLDTVMTNSTTSSFVIGFPKTDTWVDIIPFDGLLNNIYNLSMYQHDGNMTIYLNGEQISDGIEALMTGQYQNYWVVSSAYYEGQYSLSIIDYDYNEKNGSVMSSSFNGLKGIKFITRDEHLLTQDFWIIDNIYIKGWDYIPALSFSTQKKYFETFDEAGTFIYKVMVSDNVHQPTEYNTYSTILSISSFYCTDEYGTGGLVEDGKPAGLLFIPRYFMTQTGTIETFQNALWWLYFIGLVWLIWILKNPVFAWLITNILFLLSSWSFGSNVQLISSIILLAISIVGAVILGGK